MQCFLNIAVDFFGSRAFGHQSGHIWAGDGVDVALLVEFERYLLSKQRRYLLVSQHPGELKPTGGFIGSYGIVDVGPKGFSIKKYSGVEDLVVPPDLHIPSPPGDILTTWFKFRDANWWIDYPTSARALLMFWHEYGQAPVDGVIAIDTSAMSAVLDVTGPITVTKHDETFTAENLLERLNTALKKTIIMVTHDPAAAERAQTVRHLDKGQFKAN